MIKYIWGWVVKSSADPTQLSLTIKAGIPMLMLLGLGDYITIENANNIAEQFANGSVIIVTIVTQAIALFGILRKIWLTTISK